MPISLIRKITVGFGAALLLLLLVGVASYRVIDRMAAGAGGVAHAERVLAGLQHVIRLTDDAEDAAREYAATGEDSALRPYVAAAGSLRVEIDRVRLLTRGQPEQQARAAALDSLAGARFRAINRIVNQRRAARTGAARDSVLIRQTTSAMERVREVALAMVSAETSLLERRAAAAAENARRTKTTILLGVLIAFGCVAAAILVIRRDLSRREELEEALARSHERLEGAAAARTAELSAVIDACPLAVVGIDPEGRVSLWNPAATRILGWRADEVLGRPYPAVPEGGEREFGEIVRHIDLGGTHTGLEVRRRRKDGTTVDLALYSATMRDPQGVVLGRMGVLADLSERKLLEDQLRQSQKMEAIGKLAGGVAHDFNNLLTAILGYGDLLDARLAGDLGRTELGEIRRAAERAAALTRQLLAFSRQQVLQPQTIQLNDVVADLESMLGRLIGEDVSLRAVLRHGVGRVRADPMQIEQVLLNLVVNARDAMPDGGVLAIETEDVTLDESYERLHPEVAAGRYVLLAVTDTGVGMDAETRGRIFEPFFTTKEVGKGTGLGLSTVYGIVKQSHGHMTVDSAPGRGTTFRLYFPRLADSAEPAAEPRPPETVDSGWETILLAEDEESLLKLVAEILRDAGYRVLPALGPEEALRVAAEHLGGIHLLLTDVVMPGMGGRELAERLQSLRPGIRVLYMSGYAPGSTAPFGAPGEGMRCVGKPFTPGALTRSVRETLDAAEIAS
ncbi:MAG TPA: ATP-binding protein [Candidatus Eisenbacteria bacterium]